MKIPIRSSYFGVTPGTPSVEAASKAFYNVWFFYWVAGKAYFGHGSRSSFAINPSLQAGVHDAHRNGL